VSDLTHWLDRHEAWLERLLAAAEAVAARVGAEAAAEEELLRALRGGAAPGAGAGGRLALQAVSATEFAVTGRVALDPIGMAGCAVAVTASRTGGPPKVVLHAPGAEPVEYAPAAGR
jgi:hypothetical protein